MGGDAATSGHLYSPAPRGVYGDRGGHFDEDGEQEEAGVSSLF